MIVCEVETNRLIPTNSERERYNPFLYMTIRHPVSESVVAFTLSISEGIIKVAMYSVKQNMV